MDFCAMAEDAFLNSNFLNTVISAVFSFLLILLTGYIAWRQIRLQKIIQRQNLLSDREDRILRIYSDFVECGLSLLPFRYDLNWNFVVFPDEQKIMKLRNHWVIAAKSVDEANLLFEEGAPIVECLKSILKEYQLLLGRMIDYRKEQFNFCAQVVQKVRVKYAGVSLNSRDDFVSHSDIKEYLKKMLENDASLELEKKIASFLHEQLSDQNLDNYFKPYINRIPYRKKC